MGAEAVLTEIEELVGAVGAAGRCTVRQTGCLSYCRRGPAVLVTPRGGLPEVHTRIRSLEASATVVARASGVRPSLDEGGLRERLAGVRATRAWRAAAEVFHWNRALQMLATPGGSQSTIAELLASAGFAQGAAPGAAMPAEIECYTQWALESVMQVSKHSAVYRFTSTDRKRGTPHPRGRGKLVEPKTWHTTLLAEVGANDEGPLPWIEREYTPVSTAKDWESGRCDMLVKVYPDGAATSWLRRQDPGARVWLSKPVKTLGVPTLTPDSTGVRPAGVLLLLAGTGVVALPQILHHRDPTRLLSIATPRRDQLKVPIELVLSCREDDALMLSEIAQWCRDGGGNDDAIGVRHCTLLLTPAAAAAGAPPFPDAAGSDVAEAERALLRLANVVVLRSRATAVVVTEAYGRMPRPCRVVVSGPGGFNTAVQRMLRTVVDDPEHITLLTA